MPCRCRPSLQLFALRQRFQERIQARTIADRRYGHDQRFAITSYRLFFDEAGPSVGSFGCDARDKNICRRPILRFAGLQCPAISLIVSRIV